MMTACQYEGGRCSQCGEPLAEGMRRTCKASRRGRGLVVLGYSLSKPRPESLPCAYLGHPTGRLHKQLCGGKHNVAEHACYHPSRRITKRRTGGQVDGVCTPKGACVDAKYGIQPCYTCELRQPQQLLARWPADV